MAEIDYQVALLLQHQFEQEAKAPKEHKFDVELAKSLQDQFQTEEEIDIPKNGLVYKAGSSTHNSSKCLVDPSWEIIDPTPDVHVLFMSFNERFFWNKLLAVCVSWSKKMTSCAGVCSYQGSGGLCSITLSEPLLKLRPRKDLVETLLHEMIHAYLFVTNNDKDRSGHGPEFHKHMHRINKESGTNITVYHDFYDEVNLYKQHWWRCDGPCKNRRPYFGMVRRAQNRAPGPNDTWWAEHSKTCGGTFVKVREPEKRTKPAKENVKPKEDIRKYIPTEKQAKPIKDVLKATSQSTTNVHTLGNITSSNNKQISNVIPKTSNIFGFTNLNLSTSSVRSKGAVNGSTVLINNSPNTSTNDSNDYSVVRNHWLDKFNSTSSGAKRTMPSVSAPVPVKIPKVEVSDSPSGRFEVQKTAECPVCLEPIPMRVFDTHIDLCLEKPKTKECIICAREVVVAEYEIHVGKCSEEKFDNESSAESKFCSICQKEVAPEEYVGHVEGCLHKLYDGMEEVARNEHVDCLTCGRNILRSELSSHLDDCSALSWAFTDRVVVVEGEDVSEKEVKYNCPLCLMLLKEKEMSAHIDSCTEKEILFQDEF